MGRTSIEWCDFSFNPWIGCANVSAGCVNCYAHVLSDRFKMAEWGVHGRRGKQEPDYWEGPLKWQRAAVRKGKPLLVFVASMADVFEDHPDVIQERQQFWELTAVTPNLIWLLLTKRPQNIMAMVPGAWHHDWPANVWAGTSAEDQRNADERLDWLRRVPAPVRFVSAEPLLGPVDLTPWMSCGHDSLSGVGQSPPGLRSCDHCHATFEDDGQVMVSPPQLINWVIAGGESGQKARPSFLDDHRKIRDDCFRNGIPYLFKQWGTWSPLEYHYGRPGAEVRAYPQGEVKRSGKKASGRLLDGVEHLNWPAVAQRTNTHGLQGELCISP